MTVKRRRAWPWVGALIGLLLPIALVPLFLGGGYNAGYLAGRLAVFTAGAGAGIGAVARWLIPTKETTRDIDADFR